MGVACKIVRTDSGVLALDNQGKVSNLYLDLLSYFQNDRLALDYWAMTHTDDFKKAFNGRSDNMSVEDVVAYVNILDVENSELSPSEKYEVTSIMEANNIRDLNELSTKLNKIFKPNGFIELDSVAALDSGIYNQEDLKNINLAEIEYLLHKIEGDLQKGKNFLVEPSQDDVALIDESKKTILGTSFQLSRTDIDNDIISKTDTFTPEAIEEAVQNSDFQSYKDKFNNDEAFRNKETERLSKLSKLPILSFVGETLTSENVSYYDQLLNTIPATFDIVDIESDLDFLEEITPEKWFNNPTQIRNVLREVEQTLAKNNIDLVGLSELYNEREQVLSLITPLKNMIRNTSEITIQEFARAHDQIFTPSENKITRVIPEKYKGLNIVHLNSRKTDAELYREHGLIKLEENMYHKVERLTDTVAAYDYIYTQLVEGKMTIPSQYITVKDYKNPDNKVEVLKGITNFVNSRETGIVSEFQEEISLYQLVFDHNPIQKEDYRKLSTIRTDEVYLKTDFVSDFYSYVLNEKLNDTPIYRETLSKFKFTSSDIEIDGYISSLDGIEMQQELEDYLKLKKGTSYEFMFNNGEGYLLEDSQAINNPESVQAYKSEIVVDGNYVITNPQSDMFVNNEGILYRKVGKSLNADIYLKISEVNRPVYNTAIENFEYNQDEAQAILDKYQNGLDSQKMSFQEFNERLEKAETSPTSILFQIKYPDRVRIIEKPFFTYKDSSIKDYDGMFSVKTIGLSFYDDILNADTENPGYQFFYKGIQARVEMMSPSEYLRRVREGFKTETDENLTESSRKKIMDAIENGNQIDMPFLRYDNGSFSQEGRNRANLARELGERNIPVLVVTNVRQEEKIKKAQEFIDSISSEKINTIEDVIDALKSEYNLHRDAINFIRNNQDVLNLRLQPERSTRILANAVLEKLNETGLANDVFLMTSEEIDAKLEEIGLTEEVRKQIVAWHGTQNPAKNLKKKDFKNQIKYGELLSGAYFGNKTIAAGFSGMFKGSTLFKAKIDESGFETIDMKKTTPIGTQELIEVIGQERYDDLLEKKKNGQIKGLILENTYEKNYPIGTTTQYLVFDPNTVSILDKFVGDRLEEEVMDSFGIVYDPINLSLSTESLTITPNGFVYNGDVYLNTDNPRILNTQIHEFGHLFNFWAKENRPNLYRKGIQLVQEQGQEYIDKVKESQPNLEGERLYEEALTQLIGDKGELVVNKKRKSAIREWLTDLWNSIKNALGITQYTAEELENITLEQFAEAVAIDMLRGTKFQTSEYTIQPLLDEMFANKKGKMVNVQTINQILKQPTTKAIEKAIIREVLNLEGFRGKTQIPFDEFRGEVNARIMPLDVIESKTYSDYGSDNVGVDVGFSSTNIYNSKLDHQVLGKYEHWKEDFEKNLDGIEFRVTTNRESGIHYVVDKNSRITPENIEEEAYFMSPSLEMANNWIENYNKTRKINNGQFGHTRVWREAGTKDVYVAEIQSDSYQKAKAVDMVLTNYENNPQDLNSKQKPIYKKIKEAEKLINDIDSNFVIGSEEYIVKDLYNDISEAFKSINDKKEFIKNLNKAIKENRDFDVIEEEAKKQKEDVQRRLKEEEGYAKSLVSLALGEKIEPVEIQDYQLEGKGYIMPYSFITEKFNNQKKSYEYRLGKKIFTSLEDAVSYYEKNILPDYKVNTELYTKYFNAIKDLPNLKNSLLDNASLRDKQFIAHRKNYTERLLREEIKRNAELGMETLAIPTPRTLALIEDYMPANEFGLQPYTIVSSRNTDELENGDIIEYLGEDYTVFNAESTDFEVAPTDKVNEWNIDDFVNEEADFYADNDSSEIYSELKDKDLFTKESWDEFKESSNYEYLLPELEDIAELIDEETETYRLDKDKIYDAIREYHFNFIWSEGISTTLENQGYRVLYEDDYTVYTTEYNVYPETLQQPDQYQEIADIDEFSIEDIDEDYQGILKRYEKTIDFFKKERGENIETITDNKGNEWVRTELTSEDAISPVVAFQMEIPSIKNIPNTITNSKNEVATAIESSFEMLTPTEEETRNKVECQS